MGKEREREERRMRRGPIDRPAVAANASWTEKWDGNGGKTINFPRKRIRLPSESCLIALCAGLLADFEKRFANSDGEGSRNRV